MLKLNKTKKRIGNINFCDRKGIIHINANILRKGLFFYTIQTTSGAIHRFIPFDKLVEEG